MTTDRILSFLEALRPNNNREWFNENKALYEAAKADFETICKELVVEIGQFDNDIKSLNYKDCIFRIYKDTRFSHDKSPYKNHFGAFFASGGGRKSERSGYYFHVEDGGSFLASGVWSPPPALLKALRQSVYDNIEELTEIRSEKEFQQYFPKFYDDDKLKTVPRGFPKEFHEAELLKLKHYMVEYKLTSETLNSQHIARDVAKIFSTSYPLNQFLNYTVDEFLSTNHI